MSHTKLPQYSCFETETLQAISRHVITGEQDEKFCETLPARFERYDLGGGAD